LFFKPSGSEQNNEYLGFLKKIIKEIADFLKEPVVQGRFFDS